MAAEINFWSNSQRIDTTAGSGMGFYGDGGFGSSVDVGSYNGRTYITNSAGSSQGPEINNVKWVNAGSGILGQAGSGIGLPAIPNYQATLNARFTYDSAVKVQNAKFYIYDRVSISNPPSGVVCKAAQIIHPDTNQTANGSGQTTWTTMSGTGTYLTLANSPGVSGLYAGNGSNSLWTDTRHDFFLAISAQPTSVGSKTQFGAYLSLEYL